MSHFTAVKTEFTEEQMLLRALEDVRTEFGLGEIRTLERIRGYAGNTTFAQIVVGTANPEYDLGFVRQGETYSLVADWHGLRKIKPDQLANRLRQRYAYHTVREKLEAQGFSIAEEAVQKDQTIHLVLRRMS